MTFARGPYRVGRALCRAAGRQPRTEKGPVMPATYGFLSTYPPTQCGLATFNAALATALNTGGAGVVRLLASDNVSGGIDLDRAAPRVVHTWHTDNPGGWVAAANA